MERTISDRINEVISESGLSYREISKETGIPYSTVQRYATGHTSKIPIPAVQKIAKATKTSAEYILGWEEENPQGYGAENELYADITLRMMNDEEFAAAVECLYRMDQEQLQSFRKLFSR